MARQFGAHDVVAMDDHHAVIDRVKALTGGKFCERVVECTGMQWPLDLSGELAAERGLRAMLEGGCQLALGAHAVLEGGVIELTAWYEGQKITVSETSSENVAMLAFGALGRPTPV